MSNLSRDRLARPVDISTLYNGAARRVDLIVEIPGLRWAGLSGTGPRNRSDSNRLSVGVQGGRWRGRGWQYQRPLVVDQENRTPTTMVRRNGGDRGRRSLLPAWYPRTPLRDITAIVRVIMILTKNIHNLIIIYHGFVRCLFIVLFIWVLIVFKDYNLFLGPIYYDYRDFEWCIIVGLGFCCTQV